MVLPKKISYSFVADVNAPVASSEQPENNITLSKVTAECDTAVKELEVTGNHLRNCMHFILRQPRLLRNIRTGATNSMQRLLPY